MSTNDKKPADTAVAVESIVNENTVSDVVSSQEVDIDSIDNKPEIPDIVIQQDPDSK